MSHSVKIPGISRNRARQHEQETRPWGSWKVLEEGPGYKIKLLVISPSHRLSLQYHHFRCEYWVVVSGKARVVVASQTYEMGVLQSMQIPERTIHRIENPYAETLRILEVQRGERLLEKDIVRLEDDYQRAMRTGVAQS